MLLTDQCDGSYGIIMIMMAYMSELLGCWSVCCIFPQECSGFNIFHQLWVSGIENGLEQPNFDLWAFSEMEMLSCHDDGGVTLHRVTGSNPALCSLTLKSQSSPKE